jgi:hypothetical protein
MQSVHLNLLSVASLGDFINVRLLSYLVIIIILLSFFATWNQILMILDNVEFLPPIFLCRVLAAILKMADILKILKTQNCFSNSDLSLCQILCLYHYVKIQYCPISSKFYMWVDNDVPNWFPTLKISTGHHFQNGRHNTAKIQHCSISTKFHM